MGALTVISRTAAPDVTARVRETLSRRGFEAPEIIETKGHTLLLHGGMVSGEAMLLEREESGDFAAAAGTLLYKGQYGRAALLEFLKDARKGEEDEEALAGCYVILLSLSGRLRLAVDRLGLYKVHCLADGSVWSSSFLAAAAALKERRFDEQAVYEFVFQGATYGGATVLQDVTLLSPDRWHSLTPGEPDRERPFPFTLKVEKRPMAEHVARVAGTLRQYYGALVEAFGKNVDTALSGGYDSRLTLALLRGAGAVPEVHVYGGEADPDVVIAKAIAKGEGFTLIHENKERLGDPSPEGVARAVEAQFWAFDGCPTDGIVGTGSDLATRRARAAGGRLALNGGGGEVFRNF
jgi:asparagine synthase (glutamine-hydrolysing)